MYHNSLLQDPQYCAEGSSKTEVIYQVIIETASFTSILELSEKESVANNRGHVLASRLGMTVLEDH